MKVRFVGAGPGAPDLITIRGKEWLESADIIIYAGSLVNPKLLEYAGKDCVVYNSATMTLEEVMEVMVQGHRDGKQVVRLHTGDPSVYGAIREQMDLLQQQGIAFEVCPGVSALFGAAASLGLEYTLPGITQTLIVTRAEGRTAVPEKEKLVNLAKAQASMAIYLSAGLLPAVQTDLLAGGYKEETPAAIVYKATWPEEKIMYCTVGSLAKTGEENQIKNTAIILVGEALHTSDYERSRLYAPDFTTGYREAKE
ncbi:MAG: precorrin-4 C(11)-methyltransferase [Lachnospiraceae bacterium]|nr:precorrin-4 C(11)-methyltransferase [Lachnospiraceae bacterium]